MQEEFLRFEGLFSVWSYVIGHGRLLMRRTKTTDCPTRVDVLFKDVGWACVPMTFEGLRICEAKQGEADSLIARAGPLRMVGRKLFAVSGPGWSGYVLAAVAVSHEDAGDYNDPSALLE